MAFQIFGQGLLPTTSTYSSMAMSVCEDFISFLANLTGPERFIWSLAILLLILIYIAKKHLIRTPICTLDPPQPKEHQEDQGAPTVKGGGNCKGPNQQKRDDDDDDKGTFNTCLCLSPSRPRSPSPNPGVGKAGMPPPELATAIIKALAADWLGPPKGFPSHHQALGCNSPFRPHHQPAPWACRQN